MKIVPMPAQDPAETERLRLAAKSEFDRFKKEARP